MELLYGNDATNYRTLAKTPDMPDTVEAKIVSDYVKYVFVRDRSVYSSSANEPEAVCYSTTDLNKTFPSEKILLVKTGRMTKYSTPCFYAHAHVEDAEADFYKNGFFRIFDYKYISDQEADKYTAAELSGYQLDRMEVSNQALTKDQIKMIVAEFFNNERVGRAIRIVMDETGDRYNLRTREVLKTVYTYLPYYFRKKYGFLTYADEMLSIPARIGFVLFNREQVDKPEEMNIDLSVDTYDKIAMKIARPDLLKYVEKIVDMSDEERAEHFEDLEQISTGGKLTVRDCISYSANHDKWMTRPVEELMPEWIEYVYRQGYQKGPMFENLTAIIASRIDNEYYNQYLMSKLENENLLSLSEETRKIILFSEDVAGFSIDGDAISDWYQLKRIDQLGDDDDLEKKEAEIANLRAMDIGSKQMKEICNSIADALTLDLQEEQQQTAALEEKEIKEVRAKLAGAKSIDDVIATGAQQFSSVKYARTRAYIKESLTKFLDGNVNKILAIESTTQDFIGMFISKIEGAKDVVDETALESWIERLNARRTAIIQNDKELHCPEADLTARADLMALIGKCYEISDKIADATSKTNAQIDCTFMIRLDQYGDDVLQVRLDEMADFIQFLIKPTDQNYRTFTGIVRDASNKPASGKMTAMLAADLFTCEHFLYLIALHGQLRDWNYQTKLKAYINKYEGEYYNEYPGFNDGSATQAEETDPYAGRSDRRESARPSSRNDVNESWGSSSSSARPSSASSNAGRYGSGPSSSGASSRYGSQESSAAPWEKNNEQEKKKKGWFRK